MLSCHQRVTDEDRIPDLVCEGILDLVAQNFTAEKLVRPQTIFLSLTLLFCQYFAFPCRFCTDREISLSSSAGHLNQFKHQYQSGAVKINVQLTFCVLFQATRPWMMKGQPSICRSKFLQTLIFINASMTREAAQIMDSVKSQWKEKTCILTRVKIIGNLLPSCIQENSQATNSMQLYLVIFSCVRTF